MSQLDSQGLHIASFSQYFDGHGLWQSWFKRPYVVEQTVHTVDEVQVSQLDSQVLQIALFSQNDVGQGL